MVGCEGGRKKRIKLVVDREYETSSTTEDDSSTEPQQRINRLSNANVNSHSTAVNGNVYLSQNGTIVRTRRLPHPNNLKGGSPCRLGKQFKRLDKLGVTLEETLPVDCIGSTGNGTGDGTRNGTGGTCVSSAIVDINLNSRPSCGSLGSGIAGLKTFGSNRSNPAKALIDRNGSSGHCGGDERDTSVDSLKDSRETLQSHSDNTLSDEDELWMGPWNSLHIPMTKL